MSVIRLQGADRRMAGVFLMPKASVVAVDVVLGTHVPPVLLTETVTNDSGRVLGVIRTPMPVPQFVRMMGD